MREPTIHETRRVFSFGIFCALLPLLLLRYPSAETIDAKNEPVDTFVTETEETRNYQRSKERSYSAYVHAAHAIIVAASVPSPRQQIASFISCLSFFSFPFTSRCRVVIIAIDNSPINSTYRCRICAQNAHRPADHHDSRT